MSVEGQVVQLLVHSRLYKGGGSSDLQFLCIPVLGRLAQVVVLPVCTGQSSDNLFSCLSVEGRVVRLLVSSPISLHVGRGPGRPSARFYQFVQGRSSDDQFQCLSAEGRVVHLPVFTSLYRGGLLIINSVACR